MLQLFDELALGARWQATWLHLDDPVPSSTHSSNSILRSRTKCPTLSTQPSVSCAITIYIMRHIQPCVVLQEIPYDIWQKTDASYCGVSELLKAASTSYLILCSSWLRRKACPLVGCGQWKPSDDSWQPSLWRCPAQHSKCTLKRQALWQSQNMEYKNASATSAFSIHCWPHRCSSAGSSTPEPQQRCVWQQEVETSFGIFQLWQASLL